MFFRIVVSHGTLVTTFLMKNDYSRLYRIIVVFDYSISAHPTHPTLRPPPGPPQMSFFKNFKSFIKFMTRTTSTVILVVLRALGSYWRKFDPYYPPWGINSNNHLHIRTFFFNCNMCDRNWENRILVRPLVGGVQSWKLVVLEYSWVLQNCEIWASNSTYKWSNQYLIFSDFS